jgi:hypothetical protein
MPGPLADWLPLALALGALWGGSLWLSGGAWISAVATSAAPVGRVGLWLGLGAMLWGVPFAIAWVVGRCWPGMRVKSGDAVTVVLKDGSAIHGTYESGSGPWLTVSQATVANVHDAQVQVARDEVQLVMSDPHRAPPALRATADVRPPASSWSASDSAALAGQGSADATAVHESPMSGA